MDLADTGGGVLGGVAMIHRLRMARKRLWIARERRRAAWDAYWHGITPTPRGFDFATRTLRAIERRKGLDCMKTKCKQEDFLKDVANHEMLVKLDQGIYRHIVFQQPTHGYLHRFEIVTTPWRLMITGDMGTWVFARIEDMFEFFRTDHGGVNLSYWAEKLQNGAHGCSESAKVYDGDTYRTRLIDSLEGYTITKKKRAAIIRELKSIDFDDEHWVLSQINDFEFDGFTFQDVWEIDMKVYSYHFIWCCYAIVWAIQQWDKREVPA